MNVLSKLLSSNGFIVCNKYIIKILGLEEAVVLGLLCSTYDYWQSKNQLKIIDGEEYFYMTREKIEEEIGFKESRQRAAMNSLVNIGILKIKRKEIPAKNYYSINFEKLFNILNNKTLENQASSDLKIKHQEAFKSSLSNNIIINKENNKDNNIFSKENGGDSEKTNKSLIHSLKDIRKDIKVKKDKPKESEMIIEYLNEKAGTRYKLTSETNLKNIKARLAEGYTLNDLKMVIDYKCKEWQGTDMQKYLRPETLFRLSKFESYLNAALTKAPLTSKKHPDTTINHEIPTAFRDLPKATQEEKLSGIKF